MSIKQNGGGAKGKTIAPFAPPPPPRSATALSPFMLSFMQSSNWLYSVLSCKNFMNFLCSHSLAKCPPSHSWNRSLASLHSLRFGQFLLVWFFPFSGLYVHWWIIPEFSFGPVEVSINWHFSWVLELVFLNLFDHATLPRFLGYGSGGRYAVWKCPDKLLRAKSILSLWWECSFQLWK